jgi:hypothetical protein
MSEYFSKPYINTSINATLYVKWKNKHFIYYIITNDNLIIFISINIIHQ